MWKLRKWSLCGVCGTVALTNSIFSTQQTKFTCFLQIEFVLESADEARCCVHQCLTVRPGAQRREKPRHWGRVPGSRGLRHWDGVHVCTRACMCACLCVRVCVCVCVCVSHQLCLTLCSILDCSLPGSSVRGILQARIPLTPGVSFHAFLQGIFPTQGSNPSLLHCRRILYC